MIGALGVIPDVLVWPQLRALTPEEDAILTPFATKVHDLIWTGAMVLAACFCAGFLAGWVLRARQPKHLSRIAVAALCGLSAQVAMGEVGHERIQGTWEVVSLHVDGKEYEHMRGATYVISKNEIHVVRDQDKDHDQDKGKDSDSSLKTISSTYSLNAATNPKQIDWKTTQQFKVLQRRGPPEESHLERVTQQIVTCHKGIYSFDRDRLQLCFGETDFLRPENQAVRATDFSTKPGDRRTLIILRRLAPNVEAAQDDDETTKSLHDNRITPE